LGASSPEEFGNYYSWGETQTKSTYSWKTYKWCKGTDRTLTKYCSDVAYGYEGFSDSKSQLEPADDAAHTNLGEGFRTPTLDEWTELTSNTTAQWTTDYNGTGVTGYIFTSKVAGYTDQSIFIPAAGYQWRPTVGVGRYLLSTQTDCYPNGCDDGYFDSTLVSWGSTGKEEGSSIRPVYDN
jgi:hypothetical protein